MPVCYMNANYDKQYRCEYDVKKSLIEVDVEYDIDDEIGAVDGVKTFGINTEFKERDILIVDHNKNKNYLLKNSYYAGLSCVYGTPDGGTRTKFQSHMYFEHSNFEKLDKLPNTPKVSKIKVFSKAINDLIGYPSLLTKSSDSEYVIKLSRDNTKKAIEINSNFIKEINVSDNWNSLQNRKEHNITIDFSGYIEIELTRRVNCDLVSDFVNELMIFMQLYFPDKFLIDKIYVMVGGEYYQFFMPRMELSYKEEHIETTVKDDLLDFLNKCYTTIPYRNSKTEIRNIPYIVRNTSRSIEDNFLMLYRFIECYYKKQQISNIRNTFISYSIKEHYAQKKSLTDEQIENFSQEIICLRNRYVHAGYFIKNSSLKISFDKINREKNPKDYTVNKADVNWIYNRTKILYIIAIDIIFRIMLGYESYKFDKHI